MSHADTFAPASDLTSPPPTRRWAAVSGLAVMLSGVPFTLVAELVRGSRPQLAEAIVIAGIATALLLVWLFVRTQATGRAELGLQVPRSWFVTLLLGFAGAVFVLFGAGLVQFAMAPFLPGTADTSKFAAIEGNPKLLAASIVSVWVFAAIPEEIINRGFVMSRFAQAMGNSRVSWWISALLSSSVFGAMHLYQGAVGMVLTGVAGFLLASVYLFTGRNLWAAIIAHGLVDTLAMVAFYLGMVKH